MLIVCAALVVEKKKDGGEIKKEKEGSVRLLRVLESDSAKVVDAEIRIASLGINS